ncbi:hypothetical protein L3X38_017455 [Prunus dulcis]|uniref:Reverse transcriptase RNase H-like domain-containing protein n=1 Tax=Prunus dulcis TaxID=3755 RepID=A0AAD4ZA61_PRUDU|nr:hypothetical protein L3X38_017455 [Prunus dulcis]
MPSLDPNVAVHRLAVSSQCRCVKQAPRHFRPELQVQINAEIDKLINVGFIREVQYPTSLASIVPVKNGQIRICIDFRDLNNACPKDEFPLPITELLVDVTTGFGASSFMDRFSLLTAFRTPKGVYCYTMMPFDLKNTGKFLGFVVRHCGIETDPSKIKAILEMPPPRTFRQLRGLQGRLAYIRRFIANLSGRCQPFTRLMKKDTPFIWDQAFQNALDNIKAYLLKPLVLMAPIKGKPLTLYIAALERSLGAMFAQENEDGKENALYYLSRTLMGAEQNYTPIEKVCLALIFAVQKLQHYILSHGITLISKADPLRYLMAKPMPSGRLVKWSLLLSEFKIKYVSQKAIKGQALADFLTAHPMPDNMELPNDLPDEEVFSTEISPWQLYFDGAGVVVVFITPSWGLIPYSFSLMTLCSNNIAKYEALTSIVCMHLEIHN